jgi:UDP-N-acetylmuramoyl-L-alanyl-D-glutamate--2,6-diaminopimelate ligase
MEVSSHAIDQKRINGLNFQLAVFTNISHDHLDYHKNFENYINTKKMFFDNLESKSIALVNKDDNKGEVMLQNSKANKYSFSLKSFSDFKCRIIENDFNGMLLNIDDHEVWVKLIGEFNAYNLLAVYSVAVLLKEDVKDILKAISLLSSAEGRFQIFKTNNEIVFVLDYAHTDDALKNVITTINSIKNKDQQLITVFGCGGDRDKLKRPLMTRVACESSSQVILTSDNPRSENIDKIISDMLFEINQENSAKTIVINDRKQAIKTALTLAKGGDVILVAGKGHEKFQEINGVKKPFDDKEEILKLINLNIN